MYKASDIAIQVMTTVCLLKRSSRQRLTRVSAKGNCTSNFAALELFSKFLSNVILEVHFKHTSVFWNFFSHSD